MKTVGEILKETREKKGFSLLDVEKATKIRGRFLEYLEKNEFSKIAESTIVKGFIKNYAEFLGLSSSDLLAIFRRDFLEDEKGHILPRGIYEPLDQSKFSWTPKLTAFVFGGIVFLGFILYLSFQVFLFFGAPPLDIYSPKDGETFRNAEIKVKGKTNPNAAISINGEMTFIYPDGSFEKSVVLLPGENKIIFEAVSPRGKKTEKEKTVFLVLDRESPRD